jgi:hypothetical protein
MEYKPAYAVFEKAIDMNQAENTPQKDPGMFTTWFLKNEYYESLTYALRYNKIRFYVNWISANPWLKPYNTRKRTMLSMLITQLSNCRKRLGNPGSTSGINAQKVTWSGKFDSEGKVVVGQNDDLVMTLALLIHTAKKLENGTHPGIPYDQIYPERSRPRSST